MQGARSRLSGFGESDTGRAAGLAVAVMTANVLALAFTVAFARILGSDGYGSLSALVAAFLILTVPGQALQVTVAREISRSRAAGEPYPAAGLWRWVRRLAIGGLVALVVSVLGRDLLAAAIGVDEHPWAAAATLPAGFAWLILSAQRGALQALEHYRLVGFSVIGEATARLAVGLALVGPLDVTGAFLGTVGSVVVMTLVLTVPLLREVPLHHEEHARRLRDLLSTAWPPLVGLALIAVLQNIDVIVVKHGTSEDEASSYAAAAVAGKGIIWVAVGLGLYLVPEAARRAHAGEQVAPILLRTLGIVAFVAVPMVAVYSAVGEQLLSAVFGSDLTDASDALPLLGLAFALLSAVYLAVQYLLALGRSRFLIAVAVAALLEPLLLSAVSSELTEVALVLAGLQLALSAVILTLALRLPERA